jgi:methylisocitrate lyase
MPPPNSPGERFRAAVEVERPLQVAGTINAYCALLAERAGFKAIYLSGAGVANASFGLPDLGVTTLNDVLEDARRICAATELPLLVDVDTGWGGPLMIARTARSLGQAGAAGMHIEDQPAAKRCGHRPNKSVVSTHEMVSRIKAAVDARPDPAFVVMARTDAVAVEGLDAAVERIRRYVEAGADMIFAEALPDIEQYRHFTGAVDAPVLANMTEFGVTPPHTAQQFAAVGVRLVLYPLSAFRAMSAAAAATYQAIRRDGTQKAVVDSMQTRDELYDILDYHKYEQQANALLKKEDPDV